MAKQSIFGRISTLMRANINALLDPAEDPQKMLDQLVRDYTNSIADAESGDRRDDRQPAPAGARPRRKTSQAATEWGNKALAASRKADELRAAGNTADADKFDNLAKIALAAPDQLRERGEGRRADDRVADRGRRQAQGRPQRHEAEARQLKSKRAELLARAKTAEAQNKVHDAVKSIDVLDPTSELGRFEDKVRRQEALAAGKQELAASCLDAQFEQPRGRRRADRGRGASRRAEGRRLDHRRSPPATSRSPQLNGQGFEPGRVFGTDLAGESPARHVRRARRPTRDENIWRWPLVHPVRDRRRAFRSDF